MRILLPFLFTMITNISFTQELPGYNPDYFFGNYTHCRTENSEARKLFDDGIKILHLNHKLERRYLLLNAEVFAKAVLKDTTFCDAYFFAGYTLNLAHQYREAFAFHKVADSLAPKPIFLYKQNLAAVCLKVGLEKEAKKCYQEIVTYFPENPEGYYGLALSSTIFGDVDNGLINIEKAYRLYEMYMPKKKDDVQLLYGILLVLNNKFPESLVHFEKCNSKYKKLDDFNYHYSYGLLKTAQANNDEKMKKKAQKTFKKVKDQSIVNPEIASEFKE